MCAKEIYSEILNSLKNVPHSQKHNQVQLILIFFLNCKMNIHGIFVIVREKETKCFKVMWHFLYKETKFLTLCGIFLERI